MNFTSNLTLFRDKDAFAIAVEFRSGQRPNQAIDDWQVIEASKETMKLRLVFPRPDEISLTTVSYNSDYPNRIMTIYESKFQSQIFS